MRLDELPRSDRIEDRRGFTAGHAGIGVGTVMVLTLIGWALGNDPRVLFGGAEQLSGGSETQQQQVNAGSSGGIGAPSDEMGQFVSAILGSTEAEWGEVFAQAGKTYAPPTLVMFSGATQSGCGSARAARHKLLSRPPAALWRVRRPKQDLPVLAGLCDCPSDRASCAKPA